jgi:hypothetical protein
VAGAAGERVVEEAEAKAVRAAGGGGGGGAGAGGVPLRRFVNVHTTTSPRRTSPSTFVPGTETATVPFRVHSTLES